jgi:uncharacterized membrane protein
MYIGFKHLHSFLAYPLLIALVITILIALYAFITKAPYTNTHRISALVGLISAHLQLIFGLILYFLSPLGLSNFSGEKMGDSISRLYFLEHPIMMILAIVFVTIGFSKAKRAKNDQSKHKAVMIFYGLGLILVLSRIPWQAWPQF